MAKSNLFEEYFKFWKVQGTGNDFAVIDLRNATDFVENMDFSNPENIIKICRRRFGIGADGIVLLKKSLNLDLDWEFYNSDGSEARMCGNAARAVGMLGLKLLPGKKSIRLGTAIGQVEVTHISGRLYSAQWAIPSLMPESFDVGLINGALSSWFINTGVPHIVIEMSAWPVRRELLPKIKSLRHHPRFEDQGTNVTLFTRQSEQILSTTFERGVEDFTLSCGTGVIAAGLCSMKEKDEKEMMNYKEVYVNTQGGALLVSVKDQQEKIISLRGPCELIFEGRLNKEWVYEEV